MIAHLRRIRISSKKANLVAGMVRGMPVNKALNTLKFTPKKAADILYKAIQSAASNAENNFKQNPDTLIVKEIIVNEGTTYKRFQPVSRGRAHPILKRTTHITVKVETDPNLVKPVTKKTKEVKEAASETATEAPKSAPAMDIAPEKTPVTPEKTPSKKKTA